MSVEAAATPSTGNDTLVDNEGADRAHLGPGRDNISTGRGNDDIFVRDEMTGSETSSTAVQVKSTLSTSPSA